jgi:hypothetical protein
MLDTAMESGDAPAIAVLSRRYDAAFSRQSESPAGDSRPAPMGDHKTRWECLDRIEKLIHRLNGRRCLLWAAGRTAEYSVLKAREHRLWHAYERLPLPAPPRAPEV